MMSSEMTFKGMTVEQGFQHVLSQLEPADIEYAISTRHEGITPFGTLGDICDHNMLYPFAEDGAFDEEGRILEEWTDFANAVAERFCRHIFELRGEGH
ncbi:hypothetical protein [Vampirovibrio chlorellavorus]|uniref:hypothetical protein n=1 Tax=Vampirovibrio chlorellavorus TaxID=758823 RepID=UPI0026EC0740|nr:hypothetical protein [Vampirovibrio chlorellavorus]